MKHWLRMRDATGLFGGRTGVAAAVALAAAVAAAAAVA